MRIVVTGVTATCCADWPPSRDDRARSLIPFCPMDYDEAALAALSERAAALRLQGRRSG